MFHQSSFMGCLHDPPNVQQTSSKYNAGRLLDRVNTLLTYTSEQREYSVRWEKNRMSPKGKTANYVLLQLSEKKLNLTYRSEAYEQRGKHFDLIRVQKIAQNNRKIQLIIFFRILQLEISCLLLVTMFLLCAYCLSLCASNELLRNYQKNLSNILQTFKTRKVGLKATPSPFCPHFLTYVAQFQSHSITRQCNTISVSYMQLTDCRALAHPC